jgi:hypothetical protein
VSGISAFFELTSKNLHFNDSRRMQLKTRQEDNSSTLLIVLLPLLIQQQVLEEMTHLVLI